MRLVKALFGGALSVTVMGVVIYLYGGELSNVDFSDAALWPRLLSAVVAYLAVVLIGSIAWRILLLAFGQSPGPMVAERHLLVSQFAKYLPGNFAHHIGRIGLAMRSQMSAAAASTALLTETALTVLIGLLVAFLGLALVPDLQTNIGTALPDVSGLVWLAAALLVFFAALGLGAMALPRFRNRQNFLALNLRLVVLAALLYPLSFVLLGVSLHLIIGISAPGVAVPLTLSISVYAAAWIVGLVTPGAPGGLGIRETVLTLGLAPFIGGPAALAASLIHRAICVLGDTLAFGIGLMIATGPTKTEDEPE